MKVYVYYCELIKVPFLILNVIFFSFEENLTSFHVWRKIKISGVLSLRLELAE